MVSLCRAGFTRKFLILTFVLVGTLTACQVEGDEIAINQTPVVSTPVEDKAETHFLENIESVSLNRIGLVDGAAQEYQFLVVGHIYGSFEDGALHPAETLMQSLSILKTKELSLMVSLGDTVRNATESDFEDLETDLFHQVDFPVINAVGNHDMRDRELYQSRYGITYYTFRYGPSQMIVLDTELDTCMITKPQREMLREAIEQALNAPEIRQIFIFLHKALFANDQILHDSQSIRAMPNEWICYDSTNYLNVAANILLPAAAIKSVYVIAGDVGATGGNLSPFYHRHANASLTEVAVGIGDKTEDVVLVVSVKGGQVNFEVVSLTGQTTRDLAGYDLEYWQGVAQE